MRLHAANGLPHRPWQQPRSFRALAWRPRSDHPPCAGACRCSFRASARRPRLHRPQPRRCSWFGAVFFAAFAGLASSLSTVVVPAVVVVFPPVHIFRHVGCCRCCLCLSVLFLHTLYCNFPCGWLDLGGQGWQSSARSPRGP